MPLFEGMLSHLRRSRETPLQFEIDSQGIVTAVLIAVPLDGIPAHETSPEADWKTLKGALDSLAARFLREEYANGETIGRDHGSSGPPSDRLRHDDPGSPASLRGLLATWLERYYRLMREASPQAIDIAALRAEGYQDRDIAERLGLGLRLVRRIVREMRTNWEAGIDEE